MLYCDASYKVNSNRIGIGIYLTDRTGNDGGCKITTWTARDPEEAECLAIQSAAEWERNLRFKVICIYFDAKNPVSYLRNKNNQISCFNSSILDDSIYILNNFNFLLKK